MVALPAAVWESLPPDRPLAEVAKDAAGAERRVEKGSNTLREQVRFGQMCQYIETVALDLWVEGGRPLWDPQAKPLGALLLASLNSFLRYLARLMGFGNPSARVFGWEYTDSATGLPSSSNIDVSAIVCATRTFHPPGEPISRLIREYNRLSASRLRKAYPALTDDQLVNCMCHVDERLRFLRQAKRSGAAVVEVIAQA